MRGGFLGFGKTPQEKAAREAGEEEDTGFVDSVVNTPFEAVSDITSKTGNLITDGVGIAENLITDGVGIAENKLGDLQGEANNRLNQVTGATREKMASFSDMVFGKSDQVPGQVPGQSMYQEPVQQEPVQQGIEKGGQKKPWYKFWGGKRHMTGGQGLGLTYYATPVNGLKVAEPTYMEYYTGGRRKRSTRKRSSCKRRRHCRKTCNKRHKHCKK